jgi:hypothetical protein
MNYILPIKYFPETSLNVRIIFEFKDSRMRLQIYALGNICIPFNQINYKMYVH